MEELAWKYEQKDFADALIEHCSARDRERVAFLGVYLDDVWQLFKKRDEEAEPRCRECGSNVFDIKDRDARSDARYCSPKCRQKAYRKRVADRVRDTKPKRNESGVSLRLAPRERAPAVTAGPPVADRMEALAT